MKLEPHVADVISDDGESVYILASYGEREEDGRRWWYVYHFRVADGEAVFVARSSRVADGRGLVDQGDSNSCYGIAVNILMHCGNHLRINDRHLDLETLSDVPVSSDWGSRMSVWEQTDQPGRIRLVQAGEPSLFQVGDEIVAPILGLDVQPGTTTQSVHLPRLHPRVELFQNALGVCLYDAVAGEVIFFTHGVRFDGDTTYPWGRLERSGFLRLKAHHGDEHLLIGVVGSTKSDAESGSGGLLVHLIPNAEFPWGWGPEAASPDRRFVFGRDRSGYYWLSPKVVEFGIAGQFRKISRMPTCALVPIDWPGSVKAAGSSGP